MDDTLCRRGGHADENIRVTRSPPSWTPSPSLMSDFTHPLIGAAYIGECWLLGSGPGSHLPHTRLRRLPEHGLTCCSHHSGWRKFQGVSRSVGAVKIPMTGDPDLPRNRAHRTRRDYDRATAVAQALSTRVCKKCGEWGGGGA